jgi:hypothetical protein
MERRSHVLVDAGESFVADRAVYQGRRSTRRVRQWSVRLRTLRGGCSDGVQVVELDNGLLAIDVLPTRGMGIWRVRRGSQALGWRSSVRGPVHPAFVPLFAPSGLGWLEGFHELLCRCGLESNGPPVFDDQNRLVQPLHGRIANSPAHFVELIVDEGSQQLTLRGVVEESRFHFQSLRLTSTLTTKFGSHEFSWNDEVENIGGKDATLQMLYHFNVGQPLLRPGARLLASVGTVAPLTQVAAAEGIERWNVMPPPRPGSSEQVYCAQMLGDDKGVTRLLLAGLENDMAIGMRFNTSSLPYLNLWRNTPDEAAGYVMGVEPATNFPNPHPFEKQHDRVVLLARGQKWSTGEVAVAWHTEAKAVVAEEQAVSAIQGAQKVDFVADPRPDWSAST